MKVNIISINPITSIPSLRYLIHFFINKFKAHVELTEIHVKSFNSYYNNIAHFNFDNIAEYNTYEEFKTQSLGFKISKYFKVIRKTLSIYSSKEQQIIYTNDYQVLFFVIRIRQFFKTKKITIIYQQFELIELKKLNKINHYLYAYILKKINNIDLTIFSEINRLNYFKKNSTLIQEKSFVLPNSCEAVKQDHSIKKHPLFNQFSDDAFIVAHLGNIGGTQHYFTNFIEAIEELESNKKIIFIFLGRKNEQIEKVMKEKQLINLFFIDPVPHEELTQIYPYINLGVILYKGSSPNYEFCAPNKLYELWANGIPVIGHQLKGLTPLFDCKEKGILSNFNNVNAITTSISKFSSEENENKVALIQLFKEKIAINKQLDLLQNKIDSTMGSTNQQKKHE